MKAWLARALEATVLRGRSTGSRITWWTRWFPRTPTVDASRFQAVGEPCPRHWRRFPDAWPGVDPDDPRVSDELAAAIDELPRAWREVLVGRDVRGEDPALVSQRLGLTPAQQRAILNRARARLRERLALRLAAGDDR